MGIWEAACGPQRRGVCAERCLPTTDLAASSQRIYRSVANSHILAKGSPMRTLPLAQIGPAKINVALRQVAEAPGIVAAKTLSAVYRNVFGLPLTQEALTQNPANAATMPSKASVGAQGQPERDTKRAFTQAEEGALVAWVAANPEANEAQLVTLVDVLAGRACGSPKPSTSTGDVGFEAGLLEVHGTKAKSSDARLAGVAAAGSEEVNTRGRNRIARYARARKGCAGTRRTRAAPCVNSWRRRASPWARSHTFRKTVATELDKGLD